MAEGLLTHAAVEQAKTMKVFQEQHFL